MILEAALKAVYFPLVFMAGLALFHISRAFYYSAKKDSFEFRENLLWVALVFMLSADVLENLYYGVARILPALYVPLSYKPEAVLPLKLLILAGAVCARAAYQDSVGRDWLLKRITQAVQLWLLAFMGFLLW